MKVLYVKPLMHPRVVNIENDLSTLTKMIDCELIECVYPFKEEVVLICDDCGIISGRQIPNRKVGSNVIFGPFILAGIKDDDFASLTDEELKKYYDLFYCPEIFRKTNMGIEVIKLINGSEA